VDYITPLLVPGTYKSIYNCSDTRVKTAGDWNGFIAAWTIWYNDRKNDKSASAITTMPIASANWNHTLVVEDTTDVNRFPKPQEWTRLTVQGKRQGYLTYTWNTVRSTCLEPEDETHIQDSVTPAVGAERDAEIDSMKDIVAHLTDSEKVQAEFWAGSGAGSISPPLMCIWLWKEYVRSIGTTCNVLMYSLLDLAIHLFEGGRLTWRLKSLWMQARPIQEIRRRYTGQRITSWNGEIDGSTWVPYQRSNFVTPPFPDFTSGHSNFTKSFALVMNKWFPIPYNGTFIKNRVNYDNLRLMAPLFNSTQSASYGDFLIPAGSSTIEPNVPKNAESLVFNTWDEMAESAGMSRLYGGIHTLVAHTASQTVAIEVDAYINTVWDIHDKKYL
jgi:hypothetical protein